MATSGNIEKKFHGGSSGGYYIGIDWKVNSQSTSGTGSSNVTADFYIRSSGSGYSISSSASKNLTLKINGTSYTGTNTVGIGVNSKKVILSKTVTVNHNSDGTKTCAFECSGVFGLTLSGTYYGTVSHSGNGTFNTIQLNSAPVLSGSASLNVSGTIPENTGNITISWPAASDANLSGYRVYRYVNGTHDGSWWPGNVTSMVDNIGGLAQGARVYYTVWAYDVLEWFSGSISTPTVTKNTFTGANFTGHSNDVGATTTSFSLYVDNAKNTNGNTSFQYYYYSDDVTIYGASNTTNKTGVINIWRDTVGGAQPGGMYIKLSDLINKFKGQSYNGRLHVGVRTTNAYGSQKWSGGSIGVDLRSNPGAATPTISENTTYSTALKQVPNSSSKYFIPNGTDKIRVDWTAGTDTIGQPLTYDVQYKIGNGSYVNAATNLSDRARDIVLPTQSSSQSLTIKVITRTAYGNWAEATSASKTLHFYKEPSVNVISVNRTATTATAVISLSYSSSISQTCTARYTGASTGNLASNTSNQTITASGLDETKTSSWTVYVKDNLYLQTEKSISISIPTQIPALSIRSNGVGINATPDGSAKLIVNGGLKVDGKLITGGATDEGAYRYGAQRATDECFRHGNNGISVYNNTGGGTVAITRVDDSTAPNTSRKLLKISNTGGAAPGHGGFSWQHGSYASGIWNYIIVAKIPTGKWLTYHNNAYGDGSSFEWISDNVGTGDWKTYIGRAKAGKTGTFSSIGFFAVNGGSTGFDWYLARATYYEAGNDAITPFIESNGVMEVGQYIDFHHVGNTTSDYNLRIESTPYSTLKLQTNNGNLELGPQNSGHCHYITDRSNHWFNTDIKVSGEIYAGSNYSNQVWHSGNISPFNLWADNWCRRTGYYSYLFHQSTKSSGCLVIAPSTATNGTTGNWDAEYNFYPDGRFDAKEISCRSKITLNSGTAIFSGHNGNYILKDHSNGNVTVSAAGGYLYLGYQNTTGFNIGSTDYWEVGAGSGANLRMNAVWSGSSGSEFSFYNSKGNGWGFLGNTDNKWFRVYGSSGSVSDRNLKYEITKASTEEQYDNVKALGIYNYRSISTENDKDTNEVIRTFERQDLSLGTMVDELPLETTFYDNEGGEKGDKAVDIYSYTTMILGALQETMKKVEELERKVEELENGITN